MTSRPRDDEPRQCRRWNRKTETWGWKKRYADRAEALADSAGQDVYVCGECGFWHRASALPAPRTMTVTFTYRQGKLPRIMRHR